MSTIDSDYIKQMATQLAGFEVQSAISKAERNEANYKTRLQALTTLESSLSSFRSAVNGLKGANKSVLTNTATFGKEGYATATVSTTAVAGNYSFFVEQLAANHQIAAQGITDADVPTSGVLTIGQGANSFTVDLSSIDTNSDGATLAELAAAINSASGNTGVKATLVRSNGEVSLVMGAEKAGTENAITLDVSGLADGNLKSALSSTQTLSEARDAKVRLGGETGMLLTSSTNTFDNVIDGVSLTFNKTHTAGEDPLSVVVGQDKSATQANVQKFVDSINTLFSKFDELTRSGDETTSRGVLAGDSSIRSIENMLNSVVRKTFDGVSLTSMGIVADRNGKLSIDVARFEKAVAANPEALDKLFSAKDGLLDTIDKSVSVYTSGPNAILKNQKESLNAMLKRVDNEFDSIQKQYDTYYNRYLRQYTNMMQVMSSLQQTYGMF